MRRRQFIGLFGGAMVWPFAAGAQQPERVRRIGLLSSFSPSDTAPWYKAFLQGLRDIAVLQRMTRDDRKRIYKLRSIFRADCLTKAFSGLGGRGGDQRYDLIDRLT
jgi:hypothetical protein